MTLFSKMVIVGFFLVIALFGIAVFQRLGKHEVSNEHNVPAIITWIDMFTDEDGTTRHAKIGLRTVSGKDLVVSGKAADKEIHKILDLINTKSNTVDFREEKSYSRQGILLRTDTEVTSWNRK